jgi:hypothetical protein
MACRGIAYDAVEVQLMFIRVAISEEIAVLGLILSLTRPKNGVKLCVNTFIIEFPANSLTTS